MSLTTNQRPIKLKPDASRPLSLSSILIYLVLIAYGITTILPFLWLVGAAFKSQAELNMPARFFPHSPTLDNFRTAFSLLPLFQIFLNSLKISLLVTAGTVFTSSCAAYAFARLQFPGRDKFFMAYLATLMVPWSVVMIPNFILMKYLGWIDTHYALAVPAMFSAYGTFMLRQFFLGIAKEYEEAARIDGCGYIGIFRHVILPLSIPALATLSIFTFIGSWNNLIMPLIFIFTEEKMTLPVGLNRFRGLQDADWGALMAGALLMLIPMLILFSFGQRFFTRGIRISVD
ncbi:MAG: carbohydrate ABC transporter permease, partial [Candidatus Sumerlaeia bacterium]